MKSQPRRRPGRQVWALQTLRTHLELRGHCSFCSVRNPAPSAWPCLPARIALLYAGQQAPAR